MPNDDNIYDVWILHGAVVGGKKLSANFFVKSSVIVNPNNEMGIDIGIVNESTSNYRNAFILPVGTDRKIGIAMVGSTVASHVLYGYAYRRNGKLKQN